MAGSYDVPRAIFLRALAFVLLLAPALPAYADPLKVVATIKPIHSLAAAVLEGVAQPELLLKGASSPHSYSLKPSDGEALSKADIVIRVSENLEVFLTRPLKSLASKARIVDLEKSAGMALLPVRDSASFEKHEHAHHDEKEAGEDGADVHFWLDARNAMKIADELAVEFGRADPPHAAQFAANAVRIKQKLARLDDELRTEIAPVSAKPLIVFHDVTQYFERSYGLNTVGAITVSPERQPGAKRLSDIRAKIEQLGAVCVFAEPQFPPKLVQTLIEGTRAREGTLDEIGADIPEGPSHYFEFMKRNADNLVDCLKQE